MQLNRQLNLVYPVQRDESAIFVHSMPIGEDAFDANWRVLAATHAKMLMEGLIVTNGPRVAARMLRDTAKEKGVWDGPSGVERGLMQEIRRLSNVVAPAENGWRTLQWQDALNDGLFGDDEAREVENALVFFTLISAISKRNQVASLIAATADLWGLQTTLSNVTEWAASLPISKPEGSSGATVAGLPV